MVAPISVGSGLGLRAVFLEFMRFYSRVGFWGLARGRVISWRLGAGILGLL